MQHNYSLAFVAGLKRATDEGSLPEIAQYSPYYLPLNVFTASKGSNLYILFNGHNVLWGSNDNDPRGELIEDFITENDICLMNDKSNTYLESGKGTFSSLDLSLCHPSLYLDYEWSVCEDQHGSDHFPILIESVQTHGEDHNPKWKLHKADWDLFNNLCNESLTDTSLSDSSDPITDFTSSLIAISEKCIPKTWTGQRSSPVSTRLFGLGFGVNGRPWRLDTVNRLPCLALRSLLPSNFLSIE